MDYIVDVHTEMIGNGKSRKTARKYLVVWKEHDVSEATWEPEENLVNAAEAVAEFYQRQTF